MTNKRSFLSLLTVAAAFSLTRSAFAHPGHAGHDFSGGIMHPLLGLDHLLAMVAVGLWAAQMGGRFIWAIPAAFLGMMTLGGIAGVNGLHVSGVESGIAASVLVLGLIVAAAVKLPLAAGAPLVGIFALCHGIAHGSELPAGASALNYSLGFMLSTALLHAAGIGLCLAMKSAQKPQLVRVAGGAIACCSVLFFAGWL